ncbi:MAG: PD-(D/E)XK nuclease family transposase [Bacillota bacterium]|nr:PD-(D/E)XK nuclease family transposase [Bacillota bacterium]
MNKEKNIPFYNDLLFKYFVYNNEDQDCMYLLKTIIEAVTPLKCKELYVKNAELLPSHYREKRAVLDVRVKTNDGETVNIEIQAYDDFENVFKRFQYYACKNIATQIEEGDDYNQLKPFYQIVLYHEYDKEHHELVREFSNTGNKYHDNQRSLIYMYFVFMKEIDRIIEEKGEENLNELEEIVNLIEKGNECDRINLTKVGQIMKKKYDKFMEDDDLKDEALAIEKFQSQQKAKQRNYEKVVEALQSAQERAKHAEEEKREKIKVQVVKFYQKKYPNEDISYLENLTEKQYDEIFDKLLNDESIDEIKKIIGK